MKLPLSPKVKSGCGLPITVLSESSVTPSPLASRKLRRPLEVRPS